MSVIRQFHEKNKSHISVYKRQGGSSFTLRFHFVEKMHVTLVFWHPNCVFMAALEFRFSVAVSTFKTDIIGAKSFLKSYLSKTELANRAETGKL